MKRRLFLATTALLALTSAADAVEMPKLLAQHSEIQWCEYRRESKDGWTVVHLRQDYGRDNCQGDDLSDFRIEAKEFGGEDHTCKPIRVSKPKASGYYAFEWTVTARCIYGDTRGDRGKVEVFKFNLHKGSELTLYTKGSAWW
jgi:hypothetical protein